MITGTINQLRLLRACAWESWENGHQLPPLWLRQVVVELVWRRCFACGARVHVVEPMAVPAACMWSEMLHSKDTRLQHSGGLSLIGEAAWHFEPVCGLWCCGAVEPRKHSLTAD